MIDSIFSPAKLSPWAPRVLGILRIVAALLFIEHGTIKLFGFPTAMGDTLPPLMVVAGILETFGGLLLLIGLFTRPVAFLLSGEMAIAYFTAHQPKSFFPAMNQGDAAILFCFVFLYLVFAGAGAFSIDASRKRM